VHGLLGQHSRNCLNELFTQTFFFSFNFARFFVEAKIPVIAGWTMQHSATATDGKTVL